MIFVCGQCGDEFGYREGNRLDSVAEAMLKLHLEITEHCNQSSWKHNGFTQRELQQRFEDSLTREDVDLLREYKVKV